MSSVRAKIVACAVALAAGLLLGVILAVVIDVADSSEPTKTTGETARTVETGQESAAKIESPWRRDEVMAALMNSARQTAALYPGDVEVAVTVNGWPEPAAVNADVPHAIYSMAKPVSAMECLDASGADQLPKPTMLALTGSSNCGQRITVKRTQDKLGSSEAVVDNFNAYLKKAGVDRLVPNSLEPDSLDPTDPTCNATEFDPAEIESSAKAKIPQFGTFEWDIVDASRFALAMAEGSDGPFGETAEVVLEAMRQPKGPSRDGREDGSTLPPESPGWDYNWGAGLAFPKSWTPAFKSGWGGIRNGERYKASQMAALDAEGIPVGVAVTFEPEYQPVDDTIGLSQETYAIQKVMDDVYETLNGRGQK